MFVSFRAYMEPGTEVGPTEAELLFSRVIVFSHYAGAGPLVAFVRVGTLDRPGDCPPDVQVFSDSRVPWVTLDPAVPAFAGYYSFRAVWPAEAQVRREAMKARAAASGG